MDFHFKTRKVSTKIVKKLLEIFLKKAHARFLKRRSWKRRGRKLKSVRCELTKLQHNAIASGMTQACSENAFSEKRSSVNIKYIQRDLFCKKIFSLKLKEYSMNI